MSRTLAARINPKGKVSALVLGEGELITEGPAIAWYLAECTPSEVFIPEIGARSRVRLVEILNYLTSDVHKSFGVFFQPTASAEHRAFVRSYWAEQFTYLDGSVRGKRCLLGETFSLADPYLFTMLDWTQTHGIDLTRLSELARFCEDVSQRDAVRSARRHEGPLENSGAQ